MNNVPLVRRHRARARRRSRRRRPDRPDSARSGCPTSTNSSRPTRSRAAARRPAPRPRRSITSPTSSKRSGLQPGGDMVNGQRSWFQTVPLLKSDIAGTPQFALNLGNGQTLQLTQGEQIALQAPLNGADDDQPRQRAAAVRRLRRHRARAQLGRLQGPGRARQAPRRPHQRSRLRRRREAISAARR